MGERNASNMIFLHAKSQLDAIKTQLCLHAHLINEIKSNIIPNVCACMSMCVFKIAFFTPLCRFSVNQIMIIRIGLVEAIGHSSLIGRAPSVLNFYVGGLPIFAHVGATQQSGQ